jgi:Na+:H+ antiporter, NhaA family
MERVLHPWVVFLIMLLFALVNAGAPLGGDLSESLTSTVALGIVAGLVIVKQLGITVFA